MRNVTRAVRLVALFVITSWPASGIAQPRNDSFVAGYVTAILERELAITDASVAVADGAVEIRALRPLGADVERIRTLVESVPGVVRVDVLSGARSAPGGASTERAAAGATAERASPREAQMPTGADATAGETGPAILPRGVLFEPLVADPRWPRFAASYQNYIGVAELENVGAVALGGEFPLLRWQGPAGGETQLGLQGGIFAIFDLDADSNDLVNADYRVGLPLTYRRGRTSGLLRLFHQSSHLGDEFLLRNRVERINLSYEAVDVLVSHRPWEPFRVYAGAGYLFDQEPENLDPWWLQTGAEFFSPRLLAGGALRPLAALDLQFHDESAWRTDLSLKTGVRIVSPRLASQQLELLFEYYDGRSPNGQFFERAIRYAGFGVQGHF